MNEEDRAMKSFFFFLLIGSDKSISGQSERTEERWETGARERGRQTACGQAVPDS